MSRLKHHPALRFWALVALCVSALVCVQCTAPTADVGDAHDEVSLDASDPSTHLGAFIPKVAVDLAGGASAVTGILPAGNQAAQTIAGDVTGTTATAVVARANGATIPAAGSLTTGTVLRATGASALGYGAVDLANASAVTGTLPAGNQASQTMGGSCGGTTASATVLQIDGSGGTCTLGTNAAILQWASGAAAPKLKQADLTTNSGTGATLTIQAQNETGTTSVGGALVATSGTGTTTNGAVQLQVGGTTVEQLTRATSDFLSLGVTPVATAGYLRFPNAINIIEARNSTNAGDVTLMSWTSNNNLILGASTDFSSNVTTATTLATTGAGAHQFTHGGTTTLEFLDASSITSIQFFKSASAAQIQKNAPISDVATKDFTLLAQAPFASASTNKTPGNLILSVPAPVAGGLTGSVQVAGNLVGGYVSQAMADAPQTLSDANSVKNVIITTGANTAVRALTINAPPTAGTMKFIRNNCTGSGITVQFASGTATGTIAPAASALVIGDGTNAVVLMTGT